MDIFQWVYFLLMLILLSVNVHCQQRLSPSNYVERQLLCALDQAPCDHLGEQIKESLPDIIGNNCANCNQRRYASVQRVARFVQSRYPEVWQELVRKYSVKPDFNFEQFERN